MKLRNEKDRKIQTIRIGTANKLNRIIRDVNMKHKVNET